MCGRMVFGAGDSHLLLYTYTCALKEEATILRGRNVPKRDVVDIVA